MIAFWMVVGLLCACIVVIIICARMPAQGYEFGTIGTGVPCRRDRQTGCVEFLLWKAGERGHTEDYWCEVNSYWFDTFVPDEA